MSSLTENVRRKTVSSLKKLQRAGEKITCLSLYDATMAGFADAVDTDLILVGDSLGMTMLGYDSTVPVTLEQMLHHTAAVVRGSREAFVVADMPFMTYQTSIEQAMLNATRFLQEAGAQAVKVEGGVEIAPTVKRMTQAGIPVMGHIGILPQAVLAEGGYKVKGRSDECAAQLIEDAKALQEAGVFSIVIEGVHKDVATAITEAIDVPTIGIGAGGACDGQIQVVNDLLGLFEDFVPKHAKQYVNLGALIKEALSSYSQDVKSGSFPKDENTFS